MSPQPITEKAAQQLFTEARSQNGWQDAPVDNALLKQLYDLMKFGPTAANGSPLRIFFLTSLAAKEKLKPAMSPGNVDKVMTAPVVALLAQDMKFYDQLPKLFPHADARSWFAGNDALITESAMRNSSLQGGYFIMAARAVGLDCGPMSGFNAEQVNDLFFKDTSYKINFICGLGHGDASKVFPRLPRLGFDEACRIL